MSCTTPYHRLCGFEVKDTHGSLCFMSCTTPYHRLCGLEVKYKHGTLCFMSCTTPYHRLCGFEVNEKHGSPALLKHFLREVGLCFSCSVCSKKYFFLIFELAKQNLAVFCSILTGIGLEFNIFTRNTRMLS